MGNIGLHGSLTMRTFLKDSLLGSLAKFFKGKLNSIKEILK
jgi:hypothetical protein